MTKSQIINHKSYIINPDALHHAYCVEGERGFVLKEVVRFCEEALGVATRGNPDFWMKEIGVFGVDDARVLKKRAALRPVSSGAGQDAARVLPRKIFVIVTDGITREAQNALLKLFEEPTSNTHFFLIVPNASVLLPTLRSRFEVLTLKNIQHPVLNTLGGEFLEAAFPKRMELVKDIIENKDKQAAIRLLNEVELVLRGDIIGDVVDKPVEKLGKGRSFSVDKTPKGPSFAFEEVALCRGYLQSRSPSVKMILEHIALVVPKNVQE